MERLSNGTKNGLLMGDIEIREPNVVTWMERPRDAKQKGWIIENEKTDGERMEM